MRTFAERHPKTFEKFADNTNLPHRVSENNLDEYNSYDNAVLYNDYVVTELIENLRKNNGKALLVNLSDHGEEVFDYIEKPFCGRNEDSPTPAMYTVPFMAWASPEWTNSGRTQQWSKYTDRPFTSSDLIYTLPDMIGLSFDGMDSTRSLFSEDFVSRQRWRGDPNRPKKLTDYGNIAHSSLGVSSKTIASNQGNLVKQSPHATPSPTVKLTF